MNCEIRIMNKKENYSLLPFVAFFEHLCFQLYCKIKCKS